MTSQHRQRGDDAGDDHIEAEMTIAQLEGSDSMIDDVGLSGSLLSFFLDNDASNLSSTSGFVSFTTTSPRAQHYFAATTALLDQIDGKIGE